MKRFLLLTTLLLCTKTIVQAEIANGTCGTNLIWSLSDDYVLEIDGIGGMDDYNWYNVPWGSYQGRIKEVIINSGVTRIGSYAFNDCYNLKVVVLKHTENIPDVDNHSFYGGEKMVCMVNSTETPNISSSWGDGNFTILTYGGTCGDNLKWFYGENSSRLGSLFITGTGEMSNYDSSFDQPWHSYRYHFFRIVIDEGVTSIGDNAFAATNTNIVNLPNSLTNIGEGAFSVCTFRYIYNQESVPSNTGDVQSITIPESVTSIGNRAFEGCFNLETAIIPASVSSIGSGLFSDCRKLTSITVEVGNSSYDTRDNCNAIIETNTNKLISGCKSTIIPNSVTALDNYSFESCTNLASIDIPVSVTKIGYDAFDGCTSLTSIVIPSSVTSISGNPFRRCTALSAIEVSENNPTYESRNNCNAIIETSTNKLIAGCKNTTIPSGITTIGYDAFYGCSGLTTLDFPNTLIAIESSAFYDCNNLEFLKIPSLVNAINGSPFEYCQNLRYIDLSDCKQLPSITVRRNNYNNVFYHVSESTIIYLPGGKGHSDGGEKNVVIERTCTGAVIIDGKIFESPIEYDADGISYNRIFTSGVTSTVCLPFTIASSNIRGGKIYEFAGVSADYVVTMNEVTGDLQANTPYLFVPTAAAMEFEGSVTVSIVNSETSTATPAIDEWTFCGTYEKKAWVTESDFDGAVIYGFAANSYGDDVSPGDFVKVKADPGSYVNPFRAYLKHTSGNKSRAKTQTSLPSTLSVRLVSSNATGIINQQSSEEDKVVFDLNGRKVNTIHSLSKGLYITNGKKVVLK